MWIQKYREQKRRAERNEGRKETRTRSDRPTGREARFLPSLPFNRRTFLLQLDSSETQPTGKNEIQKQSVSPKILTLQRIAGRIFEPESKRTHKSPRTIQHIPINDSLLLELIHASLEPSRGSRRSSRGTERGWNGRWRSEDGVQEDFGEPPEGKLSRERRDR